MVWYLLGISSSYINQALHIPPRTLLRPILLAHIIEIPSSLFLKLNIHLEALTNIVNVS